MNRTITKSDLCWVIIKATGLSMTFSAMAGLFGAYVGWVAVKDDLRPIRGASMNPLKTMVFVSVVPLAVGIYLLKSGRTIHRCLMSVPAEVSEAGHGSIDPATGLSESELKAFAEWLERHPEFRSRAQLDQVALFRDAQRSGR